MKTFIEQSERDDVEYSDAVDPIDSDRTYTETEHLLLAEDGYEIVG